jgi:nitrous oxide reductase accessory protein NosL
MINYKWAMFNSYVKLPEGTQQKHTQTVIFINQLKRGFEWSDPHQMQWIQSILRAFACWVAPVVGRSHPK